MSTFTYQSFLDYAPQTVAEGDTTLYAGPSALLTGLPAAHTDRHYWENTGDGTAPRNDLNVTDERAFHRKARQGKGSLLLYAADQSLLVTLPMNIYAHSGMPDERDDSALWTLSNLKRSFYRYYISPYHQSFWRTQGLRQGYTFGYPKMYYELEPVVVEADGGLLGSHVLYHANVKAAGTAAAAYLLYTEDAFGTALADVPSATELATATPEQLQLNDGNRQLVWLKLPVGDIVSSVVKLSSAELGASAHMMATNSIHFAIDVLPPERAVAAVDATRQALINAGVRGYNHEAAMKLAEWQYYMDIGSLYGPMDISQLAQGVIAPSRLSSLTSMFTFPTTGKFYFEVDMPQSGNKYGGIAFVAREGDISFGDFDGAAYGGAGYVNTTYSSYPYGTNTVRVLVDMDALTVTFKMGEHDVSDSSGTVTTLASRREYCVAVGINAYGSGAADSMRLRFTDADFLFAKPDGYAAVATLMAQASSI